jgi:hypothetical protein
MKKREFQKFAALYLVPQLSGFVADGNLIYRVPVGEILLGFLFDRSAFSAESFQPQAFVQPLYIPSEHLVLNLGERFGGVWKFQAGGEQTLAQRLLHAIHDTGLPFIAKLSSPSQLVQIIRKERPWLDRSDYLQQVVAYSLILLGKNDEALESLDKLAETVNPINDVRPWVKKIHTDVGVLKQAMMRDPEDARRMLRRWTEETRQKLHLPA